MYLQQTCRVENSLDSDQPAILEPSFQNGSMHIYKGVNMYNKIIDQTESYNYTLQYEIKHDYIYIKSKVTLHFSVLIPTHNLILLQAT